ncbi:MAG: hypothetical protein D4R64_18190 [Porphyromonadaceae bacterium]|nr:MAG: hypothetical protein D4R64_18190 [Porphyromonadaceae bacterium]
MDMTSGKLLRKSGETLCDALEIKPVSNEAVLEKMKEKFSGNKGFSAFGDFLEVKGIKFESFSWA